MCDIFASSHYSPDLNPEIHGFLREQNRHDKKGLIHDEKRNTTKTECELRKVLDGLEKLGFNLVTTAAYQLEDRWYNEYVLHRELIPAEINPDVVKRLSTTSKQERNRHSSSSSAANDYYRRH